MGINTRERYENRLIERRIVPTDSQLELMEQVIETYCKKFYRYTPDGLRGEAYFGLLAGIRTHKNDESFNLEKHIKVSVWYYILNIFKRESKKHEGVLSISIEDLEIREDKNESADFGIKEDSDYFKKIIKNAFIKSETHKTNLYPGKLKFKIWYDMYVLKLTEKEIQEKYNIKSIAATKALLRKIRKIFNKIQKQIIEDHPSCY